MNLRLLLPTDILVDETVKKISAEANNGAFTILPRHIDFATVLIPGIFSYVDEQGKEVFFAMDEGVLIKRGNDVRVSVRQAMRGDNLEHLSQVLREQFEQINDRERKARRVLADLESTLVRHFIEMDKFD